MPAPPRLIAAVDLSVAPVTGSSVGCGRRSVRWAPGTCRWGAVAELSPRSAVWGRRLSCLPGFWPESDSSHVFPDYSPFRG